MTMSCFAAQQHAHHESHDLIDVTGSAISCEGRHRKRKRTMVPSGHRWGRTHPTHPERRPTRVEVRLPARQGCQARKPRPQHQAMLLRPFGTQASLPHDLQARQSPALLTWLAADCRGESTLAPAWLGLCSSSACYVMLRAACSWGHLDALQAPPFTCPKILTGSRFTFNAFWSQGYQTSGRRDRLPCPADKHSHAPSRTLFVRHWTSLCYICTCPDKFKALALLGVCDSTCTFCIQYFEMLCSGAEYPLR